MTANVAVAGRREADVPTPELGDHDEEGTVSTVQLLQDGKTSTADPDRDVGDSSTQITGGVSLGDVVVVPRGDQRRHDDDAVSAARAVAASGRRRRRARRRQPSEAAADGRAASRDRAAPVIKTTRWARTRCTPSAGSR